MRRAFTLLEILIVLAITGILAALLFPVITRAREQGRRVVCISQLHQVGLAFTLYRQDYNGLPAHLSVIHPLYLQNAQPLVCPSDRHRGQHDGNLRLEGNLFLAGGVSYEYIPQWKIAQNLDWYQPALNFGNGKWEDLTPLAGCPWHWAKQFNRDQEGNVPNAQGWHLYLTLGGSVRKVRVEESLTHFTPNRYR